MVHVPPRCFHGFTFHHKLLLLTHMCMHTYKHSFIICLFVNIVQVSHVNLLLPCLFTEYTADLYAKHWLCDGNDGDDYKCRLVDELAGLL